MKKMFFKSAIAAFAVVAMVACDGSSKKSSDDDSSSDKTEQNDSTKENNNGENKGGNTAVNVNVFEDPTIVALKEQIEKAKELGLPEDQIEMLQNRMQEAIEAAQKAANVPTSFSDAEDALNALGNAFGEYGNEDAKELYESLGKAYGAINDGNVAGAYNDLQEAVKSSSDLFGEDFSW